MAGPSNGGAVTWADLRTSDEGIASVSTTAQAEVEDRIAEIWGQFRSDGDGGAVITEVDEEVLCRADHIEYLRGGINRLGKGYTALDASRPWLVYWITHSLDLLGVDLTAEEQTRCIDLLRRCQGPDGGFGGGPGQLPHLAASYAAVNAIAVIGTEEAYGIVNRQKLVAWLSSLKQDDGSWLMHEDGESDVRGAYCAASIATMLGVASDDLFRNTAEWVVRCQTYDGGISAVPGTEAHGGYAFCGLAALGLLGCAERIDANKLASWVVHRQMRFEGGFQGRPNKLVDGCYSFWVGGVYPLLQPLLQTESTLYKPAYLQDYILRCCQAPMGGLRDKPGKNRDYYHTCYCLSGLSSSQHLAEDSNPGSAEDTLRPTHSLFNVTTTKAGSIVAYFKEQPL